MLIDAQIQERLEALVRRERRVRLWRSLAVAWAAAGCAGLTLWLIEKQMGWRSWSGMALIALGAVASTAVLYRRNQNRPANTRDIARIVETLHPELNGRLITVLQQQPGSDGRLNYLQQRLVQETIECSHRADWADATPVINLRLAQAANVSAFGLLVAALFLLRGSGGGSFPKGTTSQGITVTPGNVSLERGSALLVLARFTGRLPATVNLVTGAGAVIQRVPLLKSLGDPLFGGSVPEVTSNLVYHIEYGSERTPDYTVSVYEHPRLERADAELNYPTYTGLPHKKVENTRRVSAVEGSHLDLALKFNKPVSSARLLARDKSGESVALKVDPVAPAASLSQFSLDASRSYDLQLVDSDGRTNKVPAEFVFEALKNRPPELRLTSPRGDVRPSALEELSFEGTVWDDFGVKAFGIAFAVNGKDPKFVEIGGQIAGNEKKTFQHRLRLEELGIRPDELVSWFVWADDLGPDGQPRRTMGDLYFGEVRPFEEVFREGQGMDGGGEKMGQEKENATAKLAELQKQIVNATWKLERDHTRSGDRKAGAPAAADPPNPPPARPDKHSLNSIGAEHQLIARLLQVNRRYAVAGQASPTRASEPAEAPPRPSGSSTTKNQPVKYEDDAGVVLDSQAQALEQAKSVLQRQHDPQAARLWEKAVNDMEASLARLEKATNSPAALKEALGAEQEAYQALLRLQAHEYEVSRSRNSSQSSSRNQQMQRQLEELDLSQSENKYENQREAQRAQNPQQREQLQIMSRLQELARRQQDLNERLKELQTALQEAKTEEQRADIRRQLKRLQEEEQQMLADVDEVRQRMDRPENQSQLAQERKQLDQTRDEVKRAADSAAQGAASQALAAGTRAQNQLQQLRDDIRKKNSSEFAEDLRQLRSQARELSRQQQQILTNIQQNATTDQKSLSGTGDQDQIRAQLAKQKQLMSNIVERASQISQQAEEAEPLLSQQLNDAVRKFTQDSAKDLKEAQNELMRQGPMTRGLYDLLRDNSEQGATKLEELTSEMLRLGFLPQANRLGERARTGIESLKKGVEHAAESVLGDDTESLRLAERQLDQLANELGSEIAEAQGQSAQTNGQSARGGSSKASANGAPGSDTNQLAQAQPSKQGGTQQGQSGDQASDQQGQAGSQGQSQKSGSQPGGSEQASSPQDAQSQSPRGQQAGGQQPGGQQPGGQQPGGQQPGGQQPGGQQPGGQQAGGQPGTQASSQATPSQPSDQQGEAGQNNGAPGRPRTRRSLQAGQRGGAADAGGDPQEATAGPGARGGARDWNQLLTENANRQAAPLTGEDFSSWSDGLREVEQLVDDPAMRDDIAKARERARLTRQDFKRERKKPDWAVVQLQVMKPLTEVRDRIAEELARRESRDALVPLDRDPVPNRYSELVRRYYQELGKDK
jgi:hypothetical protein